MCKVVMLDGYLFYPSMHLKLLITWGSYVTAFVKKRFLKAWSIRDTLYLLSRRLAAQLYRHCEEMAAQHIFLRPSDRWCVCVRACKKWLAVLRDIHPIGSTAKDWHRVGIAPLQVLHTQPNLVKLAQCQRLLGCEVGLLLQSLQPWPQIMWHSIGNNLLYARAVMHIYVMVSGTIFVTMRSRREPLLLWNWFDIICGFSGTAAKHVLEGHPAAPVHSRSRS